MDCGNHSCTKTCHPDECDECLLKPELIDRCSCGKSDIETLLLQAKESETTPPMEVPSCTSSNKKPKKKKKKDNVEETKDECSSEILWPRTSCLDPLPRCRQVCGKELPCGTEGRFAIGTLLCIK